MPDDGYPRSMIDMGSGAVYAEEDCGLGILDKKLDVRLGLLAADVMA